MLWRFAHQKGLPPPRCSCPSPRARRRGPPLQTPRIGFAHVDCHPARTCPFRQSSAASCGSVGACAPPRVPEPQSRPPLAQPLPPWRMLGHAASRSCAITATASWRPCSATLMVSESGPPVRRRTTSDVHPYASDVPGQPPAPFQTSSANCAALPLCCRCLPLPTV